MPCIFHCLCKSFPLIANFQPLENLIPCKSTKNRTVSNPSGFPLVKTANYFTCSTNGFIRTYVFSRSRSNGRNTLVSFCSEGDTFGEIATTHLAKEPLNEFEELELVGKPSSPNPLTNGFAAEELDSGHKNLDKEEVLEPFYRFFRTKDLVERDFDSEDAIVRNSFEEEGNKIKVAVEYYDPKPGDFVVGVVVSGNENKLDVNIGADMLGTLLTKEVLPLYDRELDNLLRDVEKEAEEFMVKGKMGILRNEEALSGELVPGRPVVEIGTVLFAEVLGRTLSGRPLLSSRRLFRRVAWHRLRQIKQLNEPIEVKITEWNTGGLLTRIEGLRAFLPKAELINKVNSFTELKENVGRRIYVQITKINEETSDLILSEKEAWNALHLKEGTLLEGTVKKIFQYGAQIRIGNSNRSGLLHISNVTRPRIASLNDLLAVDEKVKVLVVKSMFPDKISLSIVDLESEPGLFLSNKERVFSEAEEMARRYRQKLPSVSATRRLEHLSNDAVPFEDEGKSYANWNWFKFERYKESE